MPRVWIAIAVSLGVFVVVAGITIPGLTAT